MSVNQSTNSRNCKSIIKFPYYLPTWSDCPWYIYSTSRTFRSLFHLFCRVFCFVLFLSSQLHWCLSFSSFQMPKILFYLVQALGDTYATASKWSISVVQSQRKLTPKCTIILSMYPSVDQINRLINYSISQAPLQLT